MRTRRPTQRQTTAEVLTRILAATLSPRTLDQLVNHLTHHLSRTRMHTLATELHDALTGHPLNPTGVTFRADTGDSHRCLYRLDDATLHLPDGTEQTADLTNLDAAPGLNDQLVTLSRYELPDPGDPLTILFGR